MNIMQVATNEEELSRLQKEILWIQIIGFPGAALIGLALYAIFGAQGEAFHPALDDMRVVYPMLALGVGIEIWQLVKLLPLLRKASALRKR